MWTSLSVKLISCKSSLKKLNTVVFASSFIWYPTFTILGSHIFNLSWTMQTTEWKEGISQDLWPKINVSLHWLFYVSRIFPFLKKESNKLYNPTSINVLKSFSVVYSVLNQKDISVPELQRDKVIIQYVHLILVPNSLD